MSTESIPSSVRQALRSDISRLEDECFGDLPIIQQRIMKSHAMMDNKETYIYNKISPEKTDNLKYLPDNSPQVQNAQKLVDNIVKRMVNGNSAASEYLKNFMSDKKIKAHIINQPIMDACCNGLDNKTKELHLSFCSGCFMYQKNNPDFANEDTFAVTVGHEIGHAIEQENRGIKCSEQTTNHNINGREIESFCDMFGLACVASAGYNLQSYIDQCAFFEKKDAETHSPNNPHPLLSQRKRLAEMVKQAYHNNITERTLFPEEITSLEWDFSPAQQMSEHSDKTSINNRRSRDER